MTIKEYARQDSNPWGLLIRNQILSAGYLRMHVFLSYRTSSGNNPYE